MTIYTKEINWIDFGPDQELINELKYEFEPELDEEWEKFKVTQRELMLGDDNPMRRPELRAQVSETLIEYYKYNDSPMLGKKHTEEAKAKVSKANKGKIPWNKGTVGLCKGNPGKHTEETKRKISKTLSNVRRGTKASEAAKKKMSEAAKLRWKKIKSKNYET